ncbi:hypothetical protein BJX65DRAFT_264773 [Aspergillus insuetus]
MQARGYTLDFDCQWSGYAALSASFSPLHVGVFKSASSRGSCGFTGLLKLCPSSSRSPYLNFTPGMSIHRV